MATESLSQVSTPAGSEDGDALQVVPITLAGEEIHLPIEVRENDGDATQCQPNCHIWV